MFGLLSPYVLVSSLHFISELVSCTWHFTYMFISTEINLLLEIVSLWSHQGHIQWQTPVMHFRQTDMPEIMWRDSSHI